jgi:hypothetical protein
MAEIEREGYFMAIVRATNLRRGKKGKKRRK